MIYNKPGLFSALLFSLALGSLCASASPTVERTACTSAVTLGAGIINDCKHYELLAPGPMGKGYQLGVNYGDTNFAHVREWLLANAWNGISNHPIQINGEPDYYLYLYSRPFPLNNLKDDITGAELLTIKLSAETLGPNYREKVLELKTLLTEDPPAN